MRAWAGMAEAGVQRVSDLAASDIHAVRVVRFGIPPAAMISALKLLDRRAVPHRGLPDQCKRIRFGQIMTRA